MYMQPYHDVHRLFVEVVYDSYFHDNVWNFNRQRFGCIRFYMRTTVKTFCVLALYRHNELFERISSIAMVRNMVGSAESVPAYHWKCVFSVVVTAGLQRNSQPCYKIVEGVVYQRGLDCLQEFWPYSDVCVCCCVWVHVADIEIPFAVNLRNGWLANFSISRCWRVQIRMSLPSQACPSMFFSTLNHRTCARTMLGMSCQHYRIIWQFVIHFWPE